MTVFLTHLLIVSINYCSLLTVFKVDEAMFFIPNIINLVNSRNCLYYCYGIAVIDFTETENR